MDAASSSISSLPSTKYDAFISFRGEDTRKNFVSFLEAAFQREKIDVYIDYRLKKGYDIGRALFKAIEESMLSVVIFSKNYATSKWCLDELLKIVDCMKKNKQVIIPVFYKANPSNVRKQRGSYAKAFANHVRDAIYSTWKHRGRYAKYIRDRRKNKKICSRPPNQNFQKKMRRIKKWRTALTDIANIAGFHSRIYRDENACVEDVLRDVLGKLSVLIGHDSESGLVGINKQIEAIEKLSSEYSTIDCNIFGIWGPSGIGKTTIANELYYKHQSKFEGWYFAANVREKWEKSTEKDDLRNDLVSHILPLTRAKILTPDLPLLTKKRLGRKKVLIVLDDVNMKKQIEYLIGRDSVWFRPGSVIIVTTTNKQIIKDCTAEYEVTKLNSDDDLELFSFHAFKTKAPPDYHKEISKMAVSYAKGNPRALEMLGSSFSWCENIEEWKAAFKKLKEKAPKVEQMKEVCSQNEELARFFQVEMHGFGSRIDGHKLQRSGGLQTKTGLCAAPQPPDFTVGLDLHVPKLRRQLLKVGSSVIVLTGVGGLGKTTLAKTLCWDDDVKDKFKDNIFFLTFPKIPNLEMIAQNLFQHLGYEVPLFLSPEDVVHKMENLLRDIGEPILLVLDDVWSGSESIIKKLQLTLPDYKILVTSRFAFQGFGNPYYLESLTTKDATDLFHHVVSQPDRNDNTREYKNLVGKVVKLCGNFPMVLKLVGGSLRGQPIAIWDTMLKQWSKLGKFALDDNANLLDKLGELLEVLGTEEIIKECFMDLSLFPEDQKIPAAALIDMWVELHELDEDDGDVRIYINKLTTRNLADIVVTRRLADDLDNYYNYHFITQHDLLREVAIKTNNSVSVDTRKRLIVEFSEKNLPERWTEETPQSSDRRLLQDCLPLSWTSGTEETPQQSSVRRLLQDCLPICWTEDKPQKNIARRLSISIGENFNPSSCNIEFTEVVVLVLNLRTKNYGLPDFMKNKKEMEKVKVLIVTNYDSLLAKLENLNLLRFLINLRRMRLEKVSIPFFVELKKLKKLSLFMCSVNQAFGSSSHRISKSLPNLEEMNVDYCNDVVNLPEWLCDIIFLTKLSITNCHKLSSLPEQISKLENLEVLRLNSCTDLEELPDSISSLHRLSILDISYCVSLRKLPDNFGDLHGLRKVYMNCCGRIWELPSSITDLEQERLDIICDEEAAALWEIWKLVRGNLNIMVSKLDINLNWLQRRFPKVSFF
ncbi:NBS-LRR disease resistance protein [Quillaja saponaria]|uniref:NBS-LRR disease resistance protein n=1 Tax=Quillaja saponaria TaxID=32244 RepID=A0AAD7PD63_QUISA|nr:NBS-LRR disease resistance protein [Quillaja saponaria]